MATLTTDLSARLWSGGSCTRWTAIRGFANSSLVPPPPSFPNAKTKKPPKYVLVRVPRWRGPESFPEPADESTCAVMSRLQRGSSDCFSRAAYGTFRPRIPAIGEGKMLASGKMVGFVPTRDYDKARAFYQDQLGFEFV